LVLAKSGRPSLSAQACPQPSVVCASRYFCQPHAKPTSGSHAWEAALASPVFPSAAVWALGVSNNAGFSALRAAFVSDQAFSARGARTGRGLPEREDRARARGNFKTARFRVFASLGLCSSAPIVGYASMLKCDCSGTRNKISQC
jgi:hypothetical protein